MRVPPTVSRAVVATRTRVSASRSKGVAVWGSSARVTGRLRITGSGRVVIGDRCVLGGGSIHADPLVTVRIGDDCDLRNVDIRATNDVSIGSQVTVCSGLRIDDAGRVEIHDSCWITSLDLTAGGGVTIGPRVQVLHDGALGGRGSVTIGGDCVVDSLGIRVHTETPDVHVQIGTNCLINGLDVYATDAVTIGDRCVIGDCSMMTTDFHSTRPDRWSREAPARRGAITVGANVWLAHRTVVNKGVTIGANSVISIGTIVREDVPGDVIVSSHEQRIVKRLDRT